MVLARICRATGAQEKAAMIQTRFQVLCPRKAPMTIMTGSWGIARSTWIRKEIRASAQPPTKPASIPRPPPTAKVKAAAARPMPRLRKKPAEIWA